MKSSNKQSRSDRNVKRIEDGPETASPIRLRRGRKRETLQRFKRIVLQPWIDFVNLLPFERFGDDWRAVDQDPIPLCNAFVRDFADRPRSDPFYFLVRRQPHWRSREPRPTDELIKLFNTVSTVFKGLDGMTWPSTENERDEPAWTEHYGTVPFEMAYSVEDKGDGRVNFEPDLMLQRFKEALEGTEILRVCRCPICGRFYYAVRKNKGACDEHLARARVKRGRDPQLRERYEANRRINELVKQKKLPIGKAKAAVKENFTGRPKK
jgi:hypothetical protein